MNEYESYDATGLAELVRKGEVSAEELLNAAIARIEGRNTVVNAVITKLYDEARAQIAAGLPDGPFRGVPFLLKDLIAAYKGAPLSSGTTFMRDWVPTKNSPIVDRFLATGVVVAGKTNTPEFGMVPVTEPPAFGPTRNPWNMTRTAGGSSGGSAAAIACGMVPFASGGDGGGSIRIPSSCVGLFGLKPSRGRVPVGPDQEHWEGFAQEHVLTRSVRDSAAMLDAIAGAEPGAPYHVAGPKKSFLAATTRKHRKLRIAWCATGGMTRHYHPDCREAVEDARALLESMGHELVEACPPLDIDRLIEAWGIMLAGQIAAEIRNCERLVGRKASADDFETLVWLNRQLGESYSAADYLQSVSYLRAVAWEFGNFLSDYDVWLTPTLGTPPPELGALYAHGAMAKVESVVARLGLTSLVKASGQIAVAAQRIFDFIPYTPLANMGGQPSMSVPLWWNRDRLPVGVMFTAPLGDEETLFALGAELEKARPWFDRLPDVARVPV